jgi:hypothetical protein
MKTIATLAAAAALLIGLAGTAPAETPGAESGPRIAKKKSVGVGPCSYIVYDENGVPHRVGWYCPKAPAGD